MSYSFYVVATPIGNLSDMSHRAVEILSSVDLILAEDTRHSKTLLNHYGISTKMRALHEHNEDQSLTHIEAALQQGDVALISDAGTPLISDPGFRLVRHLRAQSIPVVPIPGASALIAALSASGLPTDHFSFEGFLPASEQARKKALQAVDNETRTMVFYESPKRVHKTLFAMALVFGGERMVCVAREITKLNEQIVTLPITEILEQLETAAIPRKGEFVLVVAGVAKAQTVEEKEVIRILLLLQKEMRQKQAIVLASTITGMAKNEVYQLALLLKNDNNAL